MTISYNNYYVNFNIFDSNTISWGMGAPNEYNGTVTSNVLLIDYFISDICYKDNLSGTTDVHTGKEYTPTYTHDATTTGYSGLTYLDLAICQ